MGGYIGVKSVTQIDGYSKAEADIEFMTEAEVTAMNLNVFSNLTGLPTTLAGYGITDAEPIDATILKDADIGVNVQGYNANYVVDATYVKTDENFTTADHTKLDGIEALADVTDTTNVTAAGALMDSEVTNLADVKAFDTTDYATAAQGATADSALQSVAFGDLTTTPTTISGYGITDASTTTEMNAAISTAVGNLIDSAPTALDTLNELAASLGDDSDFAGTMTTNLAGKLNLSGGALTGAVTTTSTFDGRDVSADGSKLDGIESGATADQTKADIDALGINATSVSGFTVAKSVPSNALFTDNNTTYSVGDNGLTQKNFTSTLKTKLDGIANNANNYSHPTGNGNNHIPSGGATDQVLTYSSAGTAQWADPAGGGSFAFDNSTWTTAQFSNPSGHLYTWTAPTGGNGVFIIGQIMVRSNNTSVNGSFYGSVSGDGSYLTYGGDYGGYMYTGGGTGFGGVIAGNPKQHSVTGFIGPGGTISFNGSNFYSTQSVRYKSV